MQNHLARFAKLSGVLQKKVKNPKAEDNLFLDKR